jgi:hypothetical protein
MPATPALPLETTPARRQGRARSLAAPAFAAAALLGAALPAFGADEGADKQVDKSAAAFVQFVEEAADRCVSRNGMQIQVRSTHPSRRIKVWLDRSLGGVGTGDRSRTELAPGAAPEPLGCSRDQGFTQTWKLVRAEFLD